MVEMQHLVPFEDMKMAIIMDGGLDLNCSLI